MTFTIHTTMRHCESAGLDNEYRERCEPCDEDLEIDVEDSRVRSDLVSVILDSSLERAVAQTTYATLSEVLTKVIDDNDLWQELAENYRAELRNKYEAEYDNDY